MSALLTLSTRVYAAILFLYPAELRRDFGGEILEVFREDLSHASSYRALAGMLSVWACALREFVRIALPEDHFSMSLHPPTQADFDNGNGSCQGKTSFDGDLLTKVAEPEPRCFERRGSFPPSKPQYNLSVECFMLTIDG